MYINDCIERVEPFLSFAWIGVGKLVDGTVKEHGDSLAELPIGRGSAQDLTCHGKLRMSVRIWTADELPNRSLHY